MFESTCTLPLTSELFAQAIHPSEPIVAVGLSSGHVQSYRLPATSTTNSDDEDGTASVVSSGTATIDTEWKTRRHKGSCRTLGFSLDGEVLYSAGYDGILKVANSATGRAVDKIALPTIHDGSSDPPTLLHALSPQTLLLATDSAALHLYDLRDPSSFKSTKPVQTHRPHDDYISSLTPLPPSETSTSGFSKQWVTTGGTTLAVTDLRKGVLVKSEDQEEELLSSVFVSGLAARGQSKGEKVLIGSSTGILTLWERGVWDDQDERIIVDGSSRGGGESLDVLAMVPPNVGDWHKNLAVGLGDGSIRIVKLGPNKITHAFQHDEIEGVVALGFDVEGRMISGGGQTVKIWQEQMDLAKDDDEDDGIDDDDEDSDSEDDEPEAPIVKRPLPTVDSDSDSDLEYKRSQKQKRNKKSKLGQYGAHGVVGFAGMD